MRRKLPLRDFKSNMSKTSISNKRRRPMTRNLKKLLRTTEQSYLLKIRRSRI